jgi:hypothetical protein
MRPHLYRLHQYCFGRMLFAGCTAFWNERDWQSAISNWWVTDDYGNAVFVDATLWRIE